MGKEVIALANAGVRNAQIVAGVDCFAKGNEPIPCATDFDSANANVDCIIDFSHHSQTKPLLRFAVNNHLPLVLATTGQTEEEKREILEASQRIPLFFASNYSLGIALLIESAKNIASAMPDADIEIIEYHHNRKADAPSGTALSIFEALKTVRPTAHANLQRSTSGKRKENEIGIQSVRMGNLCGTHEILIGNQNQTITLRHEAHNRTMFAEGALAAAEYLIGKPDGLYKIQDLL